MTFPAQNRAPDFRLKRNVIVLAAMVADDLKFGRRICSDSRFFRAAFLTSLRLWHISLIKNFLFFFCKKKRLSALHTRNFYVGHRFFSSLDCAASLTEKY